MDEYRYEKIKERFWGIYLIIPKLILKILDMNMRITERILLWVDEHYPDLEIEMDEDIEGVEEENEVSNVLASIKIQVLESQELIIETSFRTETEEDAKRFATLLYLTHSGGLIKKTLQQLEEQEKAKENPKDKQFFNWTKYYWHHLHMIQDSEDLPPLVRPSEVLSQNG